MSPAAKAEQPPDGIASSTWHDGGESSDSEVTSLPMARSEAEDVLAVPLWLPYVCLTIVMLALLAVSFVRFHVQRGFQYNERNPQVGTSDGASSPSAENKYFFVPPMQSTGSRVPLTANVGTFTPSVTSTPEPSSKVVAAPVGFYSTHQQTMTGNGGKFPAVKELHDFQSVATAVMMAKRAKRNRSAQDVRRVQPSFRCSLGTREFTFNVNGSMVDVRCVNDERANTFRLAGDVSHDSMSTIVVMTTSFEDDQCAAYDDINDVGRAIDDVTKTVRGAAFNGDRHQDRHRRPHSTRDRFRYHCDVIGEPDRDDRRRILAGRPASTGLLKRELGRAPELAVAGIRPKLYLTTPSPSID